MFKKMLLLMLLMVSSIPLLAQDKIKGNKNVTTIETMVNSFNKIEVSDKFSITLQEGDNASVEIETDENLHDVIRFTVSNSTLTFQTISKITSSKKLEIKVRYTKTLSEIVIKDNAEINGLNTISNTNITLKTFGNSKCYLNIKAANFKLVNNEKSKLKLNIESDFSKLELNDNSKVDALINSDSLRVDVYQKATANIEGDCNYLNLTTINTSDFIGKNLTANTCDIIAEDSSDASIQVLERISIESSGNSELSIYGDPEISLNKFSDTAKLYKKEL